MPKICHVKCSSTVIRSLYLIWYHGSYIVRIISGTLKLVKKDKIRLYIHVYLKNAVHSKNEDTSMVKTLSSKTTLLKKMSVIIWSKNRVFFCAVFSKKCYHKFILLCERNSVDVCSPAISSLFNTFTVHEIRLTLE